MRSAATSGSPTRRAKNPSTGSVADVERVERLHLVLKTSSWRAYDRSRVTVKARGAIKADCVEVAKDGMRELRAGVPRGEPRTTPTVWGLR